MTLPGGWEWIVTVLTVIACVLPFVLLVVAIRIVVRQQREKTTRRE